MEDKMLEILLIEDNPHDAKLTMIVLERIKIINPIIHLKDGAEALDYIFSTGPYAHRKNEKAPRLILLDLKMPKVNGIEVLTRLKSEESTRKIPVVVFTSSNEDPDYKACYDLGVNSYVVKPLDFDQFSKIVGHIVLYWTL